MTKRTRVRLGVSRMALAVLLFGLSALDPTRTAVADDLKGVVLRVATWGGSWRTRVEETVAPALAKRGARVEFAVGNPHENLAKLIGARSREPIFDVIEISENNRGDFLAADILADIDYGLVSNAREFDPRYRLAKMVAHSSNIDGIVYNAAKFKELGLPPPLKYADLADPKLKGRVAFPNPSVIQGVKNVIGLLAEEGGSLPDVTPALNALKRYDFATYYTSSAKLFTQFQAGDVWAAPWHAGWAIRGRQAGIPMSITLQEVDGRRGILSNTWIGIVKGTRSSKAAHAFLDAYLGLEAQQALAKLTGSRPLSQTAADSLQSDPELKEMLPLTQQAFAAMHYPSFETVDFASIADRFNREVVGKR